MLQDYREKILSIEKKNGGVRNIKLREAYNQLAAELNESNRSSLENDEIQSVVGHVTNVLRRVDHDNGQTLESVLNNEFGSSSSLTFAQQEMLRSSLQHAMNPRNNNGGLSGGGSSKHDFASFQNHLGKVLNQPSSENARGLWKIYNEIVEGDSNQDMSKAVNSAAIASVVDVLSDNSKLQTYVNKFLESEYLSEIVNTELLPSSVVNSLKEDFTNKNARSYLEKTVNAILSDSDVGEALIKGGGQNNGISKVMTVMNNFGMNSDMVLDLMKHTLKGEFRQTVNMLVDHFLPKEETPVASTGSGEKQVSIYPSASTLSGGGSIYMDTSDTPYDVFQRVFDNPATASRYTTEYDESAIKKAQDQFVSVIKANNNNKSLSTSITDLARSVVRGVLVHDHDTMELLNSNKSLLNELFGSS